MDNILYKDVVQELEKNYRVEYKDGYVEIYGNKGKVHIYPKKTTIVINVFLYDSNNKLKVMYCNQGFRLLARALNFIESKLN